MIANRTHLPPIVSADVLAGQNEAAGGMPAYSDHVQILLAAKLGSLVTHLGWHALAAILGG